MSSILRCLLLMPVLLLGGCFPSVYTDAPLGEPAVAAPSEWDGLWICSGKPELFRVWTIDPDFNGPTGTAKWRECNAKPADREEINKRWRTFRRHGEWLFEDCAGRLATGEPCRYWRVARRLAEAVVVYEADDARIRQLLDQGKVPGRIEPQQFHYSERQEQRVVLHSLTADHYAALLDPASGAFRPTEFQCIRLPAELDPCKDAK